MEKAYKLNPSRDIVIGPGSEVNRHGPQIHVAENRVPNSSVHYATSSKSNMVDLWSSEMRSPSVYVAYIY